MRARATSNEVAISTIKQLYPNILDIGCFFHTLDNDGGKFNLMILEELIRLWIRYFAHTCSYHAVLEWRCVTGKAMPSYSETR